MQLHWERVLVVSACATFWTLAIMAMTKLKGF
jgi:hypothetical protein